MNFIMIPRKMFDSGFFGGESYSRREAFFDLVQMAEREKKTSIIGGRSITVQRGQIAVSIRSLSEKWKWSKDKVQKTLILYEEAGLIGRKTDGVISLLTLYNYDTYQCEADTNKDASQDDSQDANKDIYQEYNNTRNNKEEKSSTIVDVKKPKTTRFCPPTVPEVRAYADSIGYTSLDAEGFIDYYTQSGWIMGNGRKVKDWKACVRTWRKRDEKSGIATSRPTASTGKDLRDLKDGKPHRADELSEEGLLALRMENFELWREVKRGASFKWAEVPNIFSSIPKMEWVRV